MWSSSLCEQSENEEHENDENCQSHPEANDDGVWKIRDNSDFGSSFILSASPVYWIELSQEDWP